MFFSFSILLLLIFCEIQPYSSSNVICSLGFILVFMVLGGLHSCSLIWPLMIMLADKVENFLIFFIFSAHMLIVLVVHIFLESMRAIYDRISQVYQPIFFHNFFYLLYIYHQTFHISPFQLVFLTEVNICFLWIVLCNQVFHFFFLQICHSFLIYHPY